MSSFVFNNFKKRFLQGQVPSADKWYFIPVNSNFKNAYIKGNAQLQHYRTVDDFSKANPITFNYTLTDDAKNYNKNVLENNKTVNNLNISDNFCFQVSAISGNGLLNGTILEKHWFKVSADEDLVNKPMFITKENYVSFYERYGSCLSSNTSISSYLNSGFYFIRSKDELTWFANRTNDDNGNNRIIGVLGDHIEGIIDGKPIGADEHKPFEGILDGNGYSLKNITINCSNVDNGIVGVLGIDGIIKNFNIVSDESNNVLECNKIINLNHLKNDARDINAGILVGRNYGTIHNINALNLNYFKFKGFVPEVYSVTNKSDDYSWTDGKVRKKFDEKDENYYYLNSWCVNSPGNVCPYVGYFAEGYYGEDQWGAAKYLYRYMLVDEKGVFINKISLGNEDLTGNIISYNDDNIIQKASNGNLSAISYMPMNLLKKSSNILDLYLNNIISGNAESFTANDDVSTQKIIDSFKNIATLPVYMGVDNKGFYTSRLVNGSLGTNIDNTTDIREDQKYVLGWSAAVCYNTNIIQDIWGENTKPSGIYCPSAYCQTSLRMNPNVRAAYNIGVIAGANYGNISNVSVKTIIQNNSNFVGFIGGLAGKQYNGVIDSCEIDVNNQFIYDGTDNSYNVIYKGTPILPNSLRNKFVDYCKVENGTVIPLDNCKLDYAFSSFYDNTVNTATDVTDDCITYHLRPIFIAGALFGRYIPTYKEFYNNSLNKVYEGCKVNNCKIIYSDNYENNTDFKRIENAMGVLIGKVDYATNNISDIEDNIISKGAMILNQCNIFTKTSVGETVSYFPYYYDNRQNLGYNFLESDSDVINVNKALHSNSKNVGIYELKYNPCNTTVLSYVNANNVENVNDKTVNERKRTGKDTGYMFVADLPFMMNIIKGGRNASFWNNYDLKQRLNNSYNYGLNFPNGYGKKELATQLIHIFNSTTNVSPIIELYDDFVGFNLVNYNKQNTTDIVTHKWFLNHKHSRKMTVVHPYTSLSENDIRFTDVYAVNDTTQNGVYSVFEDINRNHYDTRKGPIINDMEYQGIQNIFDGYTYISSFFNPIYSTQESNYNVAWNCNNDPNISDIYEYNDVLKNKYNSTKLFVKNKTVYKSQMFTPFDTKNISAYMMGELYNANVLSNISLTSDSHETLDIVGDVLDKSIDFNKPAVDRYFYYSYNDIPTNYINYSALVPLVNPLTKEESISFNVFEKMGYTLKNNNNHEFYGIGEYLTPIEIRNRLNIENSFVSTSISSNQNFAGLYVIDSSGRNVMFLDNSNNAPLTGNTICYPTPFVNNNNDLLMLEIK